MRDQSILMTQIEWLWKAGPEKPIFDRIHGPCTRNV